MKKGIKILSALLLVCAIVFTSSCGLSNAGVVKNYEKLGETVKVNGEEITAQGETVGYAHIFDMDNSDICEIEASISMYFKDNKNTKKKNTYDVNVTDDEFSYVFNINPAENKVEVEVEFIDWIEFEGIVTATLDMKKFAYNDESPADSTGITFSKNASEQLRESIVYICNISLEALMVYATDYADEDFSYADLGFDNYTNQRGIGK